MLTSARTWARLHGVEGSKPLIDDKRADRSESYETERSRGWILPRRRKGVGERGRVAQRCGGGGECKATCERNCGAKSNFPRA